MMDPRDPRGRKTSGWIPCVVLQ